MRRLPSTINRTGIMHEICQAALSRLDVRTGMRGNHPVYEHGQWWLQCGDGSQYSVIDVEDGTGIRFDFEQVTEASTH
jgi:hypothetical protein